MADSSVRRLCLAEPGIGRVSSNALEERLRPSAVALFDRWRICIQRSMADYCSINLFRSKLKGVHFCELDSSLSMARTETTTAFE